MMPLEKLCQIVDNFPRQKVGVLGDVMLDRYVWGRATRISQEAPVPVVQVTRQNSVPGGAANVASNLLSLGARAKVFGVVGEDREGDELISHLARAGAEMECVLKTGTRPTTVKTRVLAGNQQVVRIDQEEVKAVSPAIRQALRKSVFDALDSGELGALILEDYAKGVFGKDFMQAIVDHARACNVPCALDPHPKNPFRVKGLSLMTPNRNEAFALAGVAYTSGAGNPLEDRALARVWQNLRHRWRPDYLLVTLGADGMALFSEKEEQPMHIPTVARQVFDVSGAGDTVMATMVLAQLSGASPLDAARVANAAAGVVVGRVGTAAIEADVLRKALQEGK